MARQKAPYTIVKPSAKGKNWRYRLGSDYPKRTLYHGKKTKVETMKLCQSIIAKQNKKKIEITLEEYAKDFFIEGLHFCRLINTSYTMFA